MTCLKKRAVSEIEMVFSETKRTLEDKTNRKKDKK